MKTNIAYLLLGSNIGSREKHLKDSIESIEKHIGTVTSKSSVYRTASWGNENQDDFLNQAICIQTKLSAEKLLEKILSIEKKIGRVRTTKWESRIIDIDILFYNSGITNTANLTIPHPYLQERKFALVPLNEIASDLIHPALNKSVKILLEECRDTLDVSKYLL